MTKAVIWFLVIFGFLFLLVGIVSKFFLLVGLVMIGAGLYIGVGPDSILRKDQLINSWIAL